MTDVCHIEKILSDHKWHKKKEFGLSKAWLLNGHGSGLPIAESESGDYICIAGDETPILAPDGT